MTPLFKKLNFKTQKEIFIFDPPSEFNEEISNMKSETSFETDIENFKQIQFALSFVKTKQEIDKIFSLIQKKLEDDAIVWFAYPKRTSKKYNVDVGRDKGWDNLLKNGFDTVRAVSIDEDWSALRFRRLEFIKK
ncbi:MAG: hypothetical protein ABI267_01845 [Ginsengibacter sp.]